VEEDEEAKVSVEQVVTEIKNLRSESKSRKKFEGSTGVRAEDGRIDEIVEFINLYRWETG